MDYPIQRESENIDHWVSQIQRRLGAWNVSHSSMADEEYIVLRIMGEEKEMMAGAVGCRWGSVLELEFIWVAQVKQRAGLGSRLLNEIESIASRQGCTTAFTNSFSFQAPDFYKKHGYETMGVVSGFPDGVSKVFLRKDLPDANKSE